MYNKALVMCKHKENNCTCTKRPWLHEKTDKRHTSIIKYKVTVNANTS